MESLTKSEQIAITAAAGALPGASHLDDFWSMVKQARPAVQTSLLPRWRLSAETVCNAGIYTDRAFSLPPKVAQYQDARQIDLASSIVKEALGLWQNRDKGPSDGRLGLVLGTSWTDESFFEQDFMETLRLLGETSNELKPKSPIWTSQAQLKAIAHNCKIEGPQLSVDTACSASLYAINTGIGLLATGQADAVVVVGLSAFLPAFLYHGFCFLDVLSRENAILPYSADGRGIVCGEAVAALVLEPLDRALRQGRQVLGVLRSIGLSADGSERSVWAVGNEGLGHVLKRAYTHVDPETIDYIEGHGTGTMQGDETEIDSLDLFFKNYRRRNSPLPIGSVKGLVGHTLAAAGMASLLKGLLMLREGTLPPHNNVRPHRRLADSCLTLLKQPQPWPDKGTRPPRLGISSMGIGSANAHIVLEGFHKSHWNSCAVQVNVPGKKATSGHPHWPHGRLAVLDVDTSLAGGFGNQHWLASLNDDDTPLPKACAERFAHLDQRPMPGTSFPSDWVMETGSLNMGPKLLGELEPQQLLVIDRVRSMLSRHELTTLETGVLISTHGFGELSHHPARHLALESNPPNNELVADAIRQHFPKQSIPATASGIPNLISGFPSFHHNLRGFHQTCTGGSETFWTTLLLAPYFLQAHCHTLVLGGCRFLGSPLEFNRASSPRLPAEGAAVFLLGRDIEDRAVGNRVLAELDIVPGDRASSWQSACRLLELDPSAVDLVEESQLDSRAEVRGAQKKAGYLGAATGVESLSSVLLRPCRLAVICVRDDEKLSFTLIVHKKRNPTVHAEPPKKRPLFLTLRPLLPRIQVKNPNRASQSKVTFAALSQEISTLQHSACSVFEKNRDLLGRGSLSVASPLVHGREHFRRNRDSSYCQNASTQSCRHDNRRDAGLQSSSLEVFVPLEKSPPVAIRQLSSPQRSDVKNVVLAQVSRQNGGFSAQLFVDETHPYYFDHPLDHVPGVLLAEGILQLIEVAVADRASPEKTALWFVSKFSLGFKRYCEKDKLTRILLDPLPGGRLEDGDTLSGRITQAGKFICTFDATMAYISVENLPGVAKAEPQSRLDVRPVHKELVNKYRSGNVLVGPIDHLAENRARVSVLPPPEQHALADGDASCFSMVYLLEVARQSLRVGLSSAGYDRDDGVASLIGVDIRLQRPLWRSERIWLETSLLSDGVRLGDMDFGELGLKLVTETSSLLGEMTIKAIQIDANSYGEQRWKH